MRYLLLIITIVSIINACSEKNEDTLPIYYVKDFDSLILKSYDSSYMAWIFPDYYYLAYIPYQNSVSGQIDINGDSIPDFILTISHSVYSPSPHFAHTNVYMQIDGMDSTKQVATISTSLYREITTYSKGDMINGDSSYSQRGYIAVDAAYAPVISNYGDLIIGVRSQTGNTIHYGYLEVNSLKAILTLKRSVFNTNQSHCLVES